MDDLDEKLARIARHKEPLRLQIAAAPGNPSGKCLCQEEIVDYYGLLCCGGYSLDDPLIIFHRICKNCIGKGREEFAKLLERFGDSWRKASEQTFMLSEGVFSMPAEDWPVEEAA